MKKNLLSALLMLSTTTFIKAQETNTLWLHNQTAFSTAKKHFVNDIFQVEKEVFVSIKAAKPNSFIDFYSTLGGGKLLKRTLLNEMGNTLVSFSENELPALVLNTKIKINGGETGSGNTQLFQKKAFLVEDILYSYSNGKLTLQWNGMTSFTDKVEFIIFKQNKANQLELVETIISNNSEIKTNYASQSNLELNENYKLGIKLNNELVYTSALLKLTENNTSDFNVYPTVTTDIVKIDFTKSSSNATLNLYNQAGQLIYAEEIYENVQISLKNYPSGIYYLNIKSNEHKDFSAKLIKN